MKKFFVFLLSFVTLFLAFQVVSGLLLTASYTPNSTSITNALSHEVSFGNASNPFLLALLTASLAYFISQKSFRISEGQNN